MNTTKCLINYNTWLFTLKYIRLSLNLDYHIWHLYDNMGLVRRIQKLVRLDYHTWHLYDMTVSSVNDSRTPQQQII